MFEIITLLANIAAIGSFIITIAEYIDSKK